MPSDQSRIIIEQLKFTYSPLGKAFEKQIKTIKEQGGNNFNKQLITQKIVNSRCDCRKYINWKAKLELNEIKEIEKAVERENSYYKTNRHTFHFQNFRTTSTFGRDIYNGKITIDEADEDQSDLLVEILSFEKKKQNQRVQRKHNKKKMFLTTYLIFLKVEKVFLMLLIAKYFQ